MDTSTNMKVMILIIYALMLVGHGSAELGIQADFQNRTARQMSCLENQEYPHKGFCCKNCEAGTYVKEKCSRNQEKGTCAPCEKGTYAEHPTGMDQCLQCSKCHIDQITVTECSSTSNTKCQCRPGTFCLPDEPCEVCKKCTKCKADEEVVIPCTATSNTRCRRKRTFPTEGPTEKPLEPITTDPTAVVVPLLLILLLICSVCIGFFLWRKQQRRQSDTDAALKEVKVPIDNPKSEEEQENSRNAGLEQEEHRPESRPLLTQETQETGSKSIPVEDEDRGLGDSLPNTTSSSQTSLSAPPFAGYMENSPRSSPPAQRQTERDTESWAQEDGRPRKLVPLLGEEDSLSKSFDLFDALDVRYHNKFFRSIGVSDNHIKVAETQQPMDKVYDLLRVWMQKEGLRANINTLLQALLDLDQRYSAEHIASKAVERGYYKYE